MAGDWREATVAQLQAEGVLLVEDGNHGEYRPLPDEFGLHGTPFVRPDDLKEGRVDFANCDRINDRALSRVRKGKGRAGDILFTHRATVGRIARAGDDAPAFVANPGVTIWRVNAPAVLDPIYLYFFMQTPAFMNQVWAEAGNTDTFPYVSLTQQRRLLVAFPPIDQQRRVAEVLGAIDDKIETIRLIRQTIESMACALFKSWFVDFDPVRAKAAGHVADAARAVVDAFPASFEDSDMGQIPTGWRVVDLGEIIELKYGKALKDAERCPGPIPVFGSNGQIGWHDQPLAKGPGIVVGRKGNPGAVTWCPTDFFAIDTTFYVAPKVPGLSLRFLYHALRDQDLARLRADSAVPGLSRNLAYMNRQLCPPPGVLEAFDGVYAPLGGRSLAAEHEADTLAEARDALLASLLGASRRKPFQPSVRIRG